MRKVIEEQKVFGQVDISEIEFDLKSRDEMPKLLMGLQYIYCNKDLKKQVFEVLQKLIPNNINSKNGRPGMDLWKILVFGTVRLNCDFNFDKLHDIANNHAKLRLMLGHSDEWGQKNYNYPIQTIKDNVQLFTPEILDEINQIVVKAGHSLVKKKKKKLKENVIHL